MIQQSTVPVAPARGADLCQSSPENSRASLSTGVISFIKSLHPGYASGSIQRELPTICADSPDKGALSGLERTELAARIVSVYSGLPVDVVTYIEIGASCTAFGRWLASNLAALLTEKAVSDDEGTARVRIKQQHRTTCHQSAQLPKTAIGLGAVSCLGMVGAAPASDHKHWIDVNDSSVLGKIGRDPAYPLDGHYRQGVDIDASGLSKPIGNETHPFVGEYDGRRHCVDKLGHCFVQKLDGNGRIDNVRFTRADIVSSEKAGVVACELSGHGALGNIEVEHSVVRTNRQRAPAGIGAGIAGRDTLIEGFSTFNCTTRTEGFTSPAGGVAGDAYGTIDNSRLDGALIETFGKRSDTGGGAGFVRSGAKVANTLLVNSILLTRGYSTDVGGGGGEVYGAVVNTTMVCGQVKSIGARARAAVGAGLLAPGGEVHNTTGYRVKIITEGRSAEAGVGAGKAQGSVKGVVCFESSIATEGDFSDTGFGAGWLTGRAASAANIVASSCNVSASGEHVYAGFGSGRISGGGDFRNLTVLYSRAESTGRMALSCIGGGGRVLVCGSSLVSKGESVPGCNDQTYDDCHLIAEDTCKFADRRVLTENCQPVASPYFDAEKGGDFVCPALPNSTAGATTTLLPTTGAASSLTTDAPSSTTAGTLSPTTGISATATTSTLSPATTSSASYTLTTPVLPIETNATSVVSVNMTNHTMPTLMPVASPVPLVLSAPIAATSAGAIAGGIVAGVVVLGLAAGAGYILYRRYYPHREPEGAMPLREFDEL